MVTSFAYFLAAEIHSLLVHLQQILKSTEQLSPNIQVAKAAPRRGVLRRTCAADQLPPTPSPRCLKESATFALGLNYVQFAKLGLKPLKGGRKSSLTYLSMQRIPSSVWETKQKDTAREGEKTPQRHEHTCIMMDRGFSFC